MSQSFIMKLVLPLHHSTNLEHDLEMLKSSILYADKSMIMSSELKNIYDKYIEFNVTGDYLRDALLEENMYLQEALREMHSAWPGHSIQIGATDFPLASLLEDEIGQLQQQATSIETVISNFDKILPFIKNGEIEITDYDIHEYDNEGTIQIQPERDGTQYIANLLADAIDYGHYTLFEKGLYDDVHRKMNQISNLPHKTRYRHVGFVHEIMPTLPNFSIVELDQLSDIKSEFYRPLEKFRSKIFAFSKQISSLPWETDFRDECKIIYETTIKDAVNEIDDKLKSSTIIKNIGKNVLQVNLWELLGGISASLLLNEHIAAIAAAIAAGKVSKEVFAYFDELRAARQNHMYFYYIASKRLSKVK